jgi:hypothetical protein
VGQSFSGRGEQRPQTVRAGRTNDPLALPQMLRGRVSRPRAGCWRDLVAHYSAALGERMRQARSAFLVRSWWRGARRICEELCANSADHRGATPTGSNLRPPGRSVWKCRRQCPPAPTS